MSVLYVLREFIPVVLLSDLCKHTVVTLTNMSCQLWLVITHSILFVTAWMINSDSFLVEVRPFSIASGLKYLRNLYRCIRHYVSPERSDKRKQQMVTKDTQTSSAGRYEPMICPSHVQTANPSSYYTCGKSKFDIIPSKVLPLVTKQVSNTWMTSNTKLY